MIVQNQVCDLCNRQLTGINGTAQLKIDYITVKDLVYRVYNDEVKRHINIFGCASPNQQLSFCDPKCLESFINMRKTIYLERVIESLK